MIHLLLAIIYLSFISLGLPDALLGAAWPMVYPQFGVPVSASGIIFITISMGTVVSSLLSDRLTRRFGPGKVTAVSVALTAAALFGFASSHSFWMLWAWAIPYGLGAGGVDAALNNYVALHYESHHMSWLHCMWGIGASVGPYIMGAVLAGGSVWNAGYLVVGLIQTALVAVLFFSLPLWKGAGHSEETAPSKPLTIGQIVAIPGALEILIAFFCYCALEQTAGLWASSYLVLNRGLDETAAAGFAGLFYLGITAGRFFNGFLAMKLPDTALIRMGLGIIGIGGVLLLIPGNSFFALAGLVILGLGCAPIYPCIIHSTPDHFGAENSQALIGVQMASAYIGNILMPPLFGLIANHLGIALFPAYLLAILALMTWMHEQVLCKTAH